MKKNEHITKDEPKLPPRKQNKSLADLIHLIGTNYLIEDELEYKPASNRVEQVTDRRFKPGMAMG